MPRMKRPPEIASTAAAAIAIVGTERTKTLVMAVPSWIFEVCAAQAATIANWSPPCPSATPCRLVAEGLGELDAVDDLGGIGAAGKRDTEPVHVSPPAIRGYVPGCLMCGFGNVTACRIPRGADRRGRGR